MSTERMHRLMHGILSLGLVALAPITAQGESCATDVETRHLDYPPVGQIVLEGVHLLDRKDLRDRVGLFSLRTTVLVQVSGYTADRASQKEALARILELDEQAGDWMSKGISTILFVDRVFANDKAEKRDKHIRIVEKAKTKNLIYIYTPEEMRDEKYGLVNAWQSFIMKRTGAVVVNWTLLEPGGCMRSNGVGVQNPELLRALAKVKPDALSQKPATQKIAKMITEMRLAEAEKQIQHAESSLESEQGTGFSKTTILLLKERLTAAEKVYLDLIARPLHEKGLLPEYADSVRHLANRYYKGSQRAKVLLGELKEMEADESFKEMERARKSYLKLRKRYVEAEARVMKSAEVNGDFVDSKYYRGIKKRYPSLKKKLAGFMSQFGSSVYAKDVSKILEEVSKQIEFAESNK